MVTVSAHGVLHDLCLPGPLTDIRSLRIMRAFLVEEAKIVKKVIKSQEKAQKAQEKSKK